jgi:hypothetical protein
MANILINFAHRFFAESRAYNSETGLKVAGFDNVIEYKMSDIDAEFYSKNKHILEQEKGAGYWLWKPYVIYKTLQQMNESDILFYSDAGSFFIRNLQPLFDRIKKEPLGLAAFQLTGHHKENEYTRKSVVKAMGFDPEIVGPTDQIMASFVIARKCDFAIDVIQKWLHVCQDADMITDTEAQQDEFPQFKDHRWDQSLWSLLVKKLNVPVYPDPSQWGLTHQQTTEKDCFIHHHRKRT